jgi:hypothetical protein
MEAEEISAVWFFNSTLTQLTTWEDFIAFIRRESFKSYITNIKIDLSGMGFDTVNWTELT